MEKIILRLERMRRVPPRFSWLDQRLLDPRNGWLEGLESGSLALYLILALAGDARGISFYSDRRLGALAALPPAGLQKARRELLAADLIAWKAPLYQVLSLPEKEAEKSLAEPVSSEQFTQTLREAGVL